jgi:hypothetical protein
MIIIAGWLGAETRGERARALACLIVALGGAVLSAIVVGRLVEGPALPLVAPDWYGLWIVAAGGIGALGGLFLVRDRLGQPGAGGWRRAISAALVLSFAGSVIAGTLALPIYGTMFGPLSLVVALIDLPLLGPAWVCCILAAHGLMRRWRRERDSIFVPIAVRRPKSAT